MRPAGAPEAGRRPRRGPVLRLKRGRERARSHPWIFKGDVADVSAVDPGAAVTVVDAAGRVLRPGGHKLRPALAAVLPLLGVAGLCAGRLRRRAPGPPRRTHSRGRPPG